MTTVTFPVATGGDGNSYSDDGSAARDMTNGGHRTWLMAMLQQVVAMAASAQASATSAVNAPGTSGTSTTSRSIATGSWNLTTQTGKAFVVGQSVKIASTPGPTNWMLGDITAYDSGTGAMMVNVTATNGSGTNLTAWTIGLSAPVVSLNNMAWATKSGAYTLLKADLAAIIEASSATPFTLSYTAAATLGSGWWHLVYNAGSATVTLDPSGAETINGAATLAVLPGDVYLVAGTGSALRAICLQSAGQFAAASAPSPTFPYQTWVDTSAAPALLKLRNAANNAWITLGDATATNLGLLSLANAQLQSATAFTTAGTAPNFTLTPSPALAAYAANQRFRVKFNAAGTTGSNTLAVSGLTAKSIKQYDSSGTLASGAVASGFLADLEFDATNDCFVILNPLPPAASGSVPVRHTVLGGPVDTAGLPSFLPASAGALSLTSQNITSGTPLVATAAGGFGAAGGVDRVGISTANLTWSGLTANQTNYLYVDVAANGTLTPGSTIVAPIYQWGGTPANTANQATFNIQQMQMFVGNGSSAPQTYRVFVGEAVCGASTVTSTVAYAYQGRYQSAETTLALSTTYTFTHAIGLPPQLLDVSGWIRDATNGNVLPWCVDSNIDANAGYNNAGMATAQTDRNAFKVRTPATGILNYIDSAGTTRTLTAGGLTLRMSRGW